MVDPCPACHGPWGATTIRNLQRDAQLSGAAVNKLVKDRQRRERAGGDEVRLLPPRALRLLHRQRLRPDDRGCSHRRPRRRGHPHHSLLADTTYTFRDERHPERCNTCSGERYLTVVGAAMERLGGAPLVWSDALGGDCVIQGLIPEELSDLENPRLLWQRRQESWSWVWPGLGLLARCIYTGVSRPPSLVATKHKKLVTCLRFTGLCSKV